MDSTSEGTHSPTPSQSSGLAGRRDPLSQADFPYSPGPYRGRTPRSAGPAPRARQAGAGTYEALGMTCSARVNTRSIGRSTRTSCAQITNIRLAHQKQEHITAIAQALFCVFRPERRPQFSQTRPSLLSKKKVMPSQPCEIDSDWLQTVTDQTSQLWL